MSKETMNVNHSLNVIRASKLNYLSCITNMTDQPLSTIIKNQQSMIQCIGYLISLTIKIHLTSIEWWVLKAVFNW